MCFFIIIALAHSSKGPVQYHDIVTYNILQTNLIINLIVIVLGLLF